MAVKNLSILVFFCFPLSGANRSASRKYDFFSPTGSSESHFRSETAKIFLRTVIEQQIQELGNVTAEELYTKSNDSNKLNVFHIQYSLNGSGGTEWIYCIHGTRCTVKFEAKKEAIKQCEILLDTDTFYAEACIHPADTFSRIVTESKNYFKLFVEAYLMLFPNQSDVYIDNKKIIHVLSEQRSSCVIVDIRLLIVLYVISAGTLYIYRSRNNSKSADVEKETEVEPLAE